MKRLTHLEQLEAESIQIMREAVAESDRPVMLYSIGKDSSVMLHLAMKAFCPGQAALSPAPRRHHVEVPGHVRVPRRSWPRSSAWSCIVHQQPGVRRARHQPVRPRLGRPHRHVEDAGAQAGARPATVSTPPSAAPGATRRKSRAKERIFSLRSAQHRWDPKHQRPELWRLYNVRRNQGESIRVFPLSNWTELDVWQYIYLEEIPIVPLYLAAPRPVVERDGALIMVDDERMPLAPGETPTLKSVRFRTLGCYPLTGAIESEADTLAEIIQEMLLTTTSERQGRVIDHDASGSMEKKKQEGYF